MESENNKKVECSVCNDDGLCKNSPSHKDYEKNNEDVWLGTDIYDCMDYNDKYIEKRKVEKIKLLLLVYKITSLVT